ncbi:MAG: hypothetical protein WCB51_05065 [Candidatus Dormiibacterota bacterium]
MNHGNPAGHRALAAAISLGAVLVACGSSAARPSASATGTPLQSPPPTAVPTPSPTPTPAAEPPLLVTVQNIGPISNPFSSIKLTLISESGHVPGSFTDLGGVDGDAYFVGATHVYFIDGTKVMAMGRDGTVTNAGQVPQPTATVGAVDRQDFTAFAVSPDESTLLFGIPLAVAGRNGATADHSQLWSEAVGGAAASATMVYDEPASTGGVLLPFAWTAGSVWGSDLSTSGLGGAGPFLDYSAFDPFTFDPASHALTAVPSSCFLVDSAAVDAANNYACTPQPGSTKLTVSEPAGTKTVTMGPATATAFGAFRVTNDGRYLAYGVFTGDFGLGTGSYATTVVDLDTSAIVATVPGFSPDCWLDDDRLLVNRNYMEAPTYLLSTSFSSPTRISVNLGVGALP